MLSVWIAAVSPHFMTRGIVLSVVGFMLAVHYWWSARRAQGNAANAVRARSGRGNSGR